MSNKYISMPPGLSFVGEDRKTKRTWDKHGKPFFFFFNVKENNSIYNTVKQITERRITTILDGGEGILYSLLQACVTWIDYAISPGKHSKNRVLSSRDSHC